MLETVRNWLAPPTFDDAGLDLAARLLNRTLLALLASSVLFIVTVIIDSRQDTMVLWVTLLVLFAFLLVGLRVVMKAGYIRPVSITLLAVIYLIDTAGVATTGTINGSVTATYFILLLLATLLVNSWATLWATVLTITTLFVFFQLEQTGVLVSARGLPPAQFDEWLVWMTVYMITGGLLYMADQAINQSLAQANTAAAELSVSNEALAQIQANLEEEVRVRTQTAEQARTEAEIAQQAMADQVWLSTGRAALNDKMRGEQDVATLAQNIIGQICRYVQAPVGSLYILEEDVLRLAGGYAYAPLDPPQFQVGEGLVGQAAAIGTFLHLQIMDEEEIQIISGLGMKKPTDLYLFPFLFDGEVIGVIEIGLLRPLAQRALEFVQSMLDTIAISFHTAQARMRINELLQMTQAQARSQVDTEVVPNQK